MKFAFHSLFEEIRECVLAEKLYIQSSVSIRALSLKLRFFKVAIKKTVDKDNSMAMKKCFQLLKFAGKRNGALATLGAKHYSDAAYTGRYEFETLAVSSPAQHVLHVEMNRPDVKNAMSREMFREILECFKRVNDDRQCRVVVVSGCGTDFCSGLDLTDLKDLIKQVTGPITTIDGVSDVARRAKFLRTLLISFQETFTSIKKCSKPVISSINGACIGAGMALISATDIRYASQDTFFQIKEVDIGMAADLGQLQRIPKIAGNESYVREMVYTARKVFTQEAKEMGLISKSFADSETTKQAALELAQVIATKSPVAVQGSKLSLNYSRDHSVWDGLRFMANWNMVMMQSEDMVTGSSAVADKIDTPPLFSDL